MTTTTGRSRKKENSDNPGYTKEGANRSAPDGVIQLSLRRNISWTFVGNVVYSGCQWAMIVVLARAGSPDLVGQFALSLAFVTPILSLTNLQLRAIQATDTTGQFRFNDYLGLRVLSVVIGLIAVGVLAVVSGYGRWSVLAIAAMGVAKSVENLSDVFYGLQQRCERMDAVAWSKLLRGPLGLAGVVVMVWATGNILWVIAGLVAARLLILLVVDVPLGKQRIREGPRIRDQRMPDLVPAFTVRSLLKLTWLAFPMGLVTMMIALNSSVPRLLLERHTDTYTLGVFAALAALMAAGDQVNTALGQSATPRLARYYAMRQYRHYVTLIVKMSFVGAALGVIGVVAVILYGEELLAIIYSAEYATYASVLTVLMVAAAFAYISTYLGYGMTALRQFWTQATIAFVTSIASVILGLYLIPKYGMIGAAWTVAACFLIQIPLKAAGIILVLSGKVSRG